MFSLKLDTLIMSPTGAFKVPGTNLYRVNWLYSSAVGIKGIRRSSGRQPQQEVLSTVKMSHSRTNSWNFQKTK